MTINTRKLVETYGAGELLKSTKKELEMLEENLDFLKNQQYHSNITKYETELLKLKKWEINECSTFYNYGSKLYSLEPEEKFLKAFASILVNAEGGYNHGEPVTIEAYRNRREKPENFKKVEKLLYLTEKGDSLSFRLKPHRKLGTLVSSQGGKYSQHIVKTVCRGWHLKDQSNTT